MAICNLTIEGSERSTITSDGFTWNHCDFSGVHFVNLTGSQFRDCVFRNCWIGTDGNQDAIFLRCVFAGCNRLILAEPTFLDCMQTESDVDLTNAG